MPCGKREAMTQARLSSVCLVVGMVALSACTSTDVLEPSAIASDNGTTTTSAVAASAPRAGGAAGTAAAGQGTSNAAFPALSRLRFAPIVGTPVEAAAPLTERLAQRARERGITIAPSGEQQSHLLKGYFSALPEGRETTIVYVWDVLDGAGSRLHRIQGQQVVQGGKGWSSVSATTMQAIADQTMDELGAWLGRNTG